MTDFTPVNELERAMLAGREGSLQLADFIKVLLSSEILVLSGTEILEDGTGFAPLLYDHPETGEKMISCFSAPSRINEMHAGKAPYMMPVQCGAFIERLPETLGIVINPGDEFGFELRPDAVASLVGAIRAKRAH